MSGREVIGLLALIVVATFATGAIVRGGQTSAVMQSAFNGFNSILQTASGQGSAYPNTSR
ncbi:MAG: hypothetical protein KGJ45_11500 [Elusimicrobia bacterium]|nr:hypothetical protein [Elusimicrobiota bacterium]